MVTLATLLETVKSPSRPKDIFIIKKLRNRKVLIQVKRKFCSYNIGLKANVQSVEWLTDILVTGRTRGEHFKNLRAVLQRMAEIQVSIFCKRAEAFRHSITQDRVKPTKSRVESIMEASAPTGKQELQLFLGMLMYNAKFLPNMSYTLHPHN